jgi:diguanylate cyclase (GGDEF)-like protein
MLESTAQQFPAAAPAPVPLETRPYSKRQQLLQALMSDSELLLKNRLEVRHLMTRQPVVIAPTATLEEMTSLMRQRRLHHLLVCGRGGDLLGVVSDRDLRPMRGATAQQVMSFPALSCSPETPLGAAITYLFNENISCLPVVDGGRLVGVLTTTDLVLTLQCTLQLWLRLAQVLQHDPTWSKELEKIAASLDGEMSAVELADRIAAARRAIRHEIEDLVNVVDLRADLLTGMSNRRELEDVLGLLLAVKKRHGRPFSLVVVAIDYFQKIRENCGDAVAKPLLKAVARLIEESTRESDFVARYRDDAFAVVLTETGLQQAGEFCRRLREAAHRSSQLEIELRVSTGAAEPTPGEDAATLLGRAEAAVA